MGKNSKLENDFRALATKHMDEINNKVKKASQLMDEAVAISEKYGLPFNSSVVIGYDITYTPSSFLKKFKPLIKDWDAMEIIAEEFLNYAYPQREAGWQYSSLSC